MVYVVNDVKFKICYYVGMGVGVLLMVCQWLSDCQFDCMMNLVVNGVVKLLKVMWCKDW